MKKNLLAIILALCMVIAMLPAPAFAAMPQDSRPMVPTAVGELEPAAIEPNAKSYSVSLSGSSHGETELLVDSPAQAGSEVYFIANPDDGYYAEVYYTGLDDDALVYLGADVFGFIMPANKVTLEVKFVKAQGSNHSIHVSDQGSGEYMLSRTSAKENESVLLAVEPANNSSFDPELCVWLADAVGFYLFEEEGVHYYEIFVGSEDPRVFIHYNANASHSISVACDGDPFGGTIKTDKTSARVGETVTVTVTPNPRFRIVKTEVCSFSGELKNELTPIGNNQYTFVMHPGSVTVRVVFESDLLNVSVNAGPGGTAYANVAQAKVQSTVIVTCQPDAGYEVDTVTGVDGIIAEGGNRYGFTMPARDVTINVTFKPIVYPVSVAVENGIGGTASLDRTEARAGDTVTLTCAPEEGYRVARITGAELTDNGDNTYSFTMPGRAVELKVLFLRHENPFLDVNETHFFYESVLWAVEEGITSGMTPETFGPFSICNRAQVVTFLWRAAGSPEPETTENPFTDVPAESWFTKPVLWALENGITTGATATTFDPNGACMRAHVVTFLHRAKGCPEPETTVNPFEDVDESDFYYKAVLWALENGVTTGADATHFNPLGLCQRAQVVTFLYRAKDIPMTYAVAAQFDAEMGAVTLSHTKAQAGEVITATVVPAEGYQLDWAKCEFDTPVTQVSDTEFTFVMPDHEEIFHVNFSEIPVEPTDPEPTEPTDPEPTEPTEPDPTDPTDPEPTDPTEPEEPVKTYELDLRDNGNGRVAYVDGKTTAAPGESIFFYALPNEGYYLDHVGVFNPDGVIDVSTIMIHEHGDDLYELIMIPHDLIITCHFYPIA